MCHVSVFLAARKFLSVCANEIPRLTANPLPTILFARSLRKNYPFRLTDLFCRLAISTLPSTRIKS